MPSASLGAISTSLLSIIASSEITNFTPGNNSTVSPSLEVILNIILFSIPILTVLSTISYSSRIFPFITFNVNSCVLGSCDTTSFISVSDNAYPIVGSISFIVYSPVTFFPSTCKYKSGTVNVPLSSVIYSTPFSIPPPVILYLASSSGIIFPLSYNVTFKLYVGIVSFLIVAFKTGFILSVSSRLPAPSKLPLIISNASPVSLLVILNVTSLLSSI